MAQHHPTDIKLHTQSKSLEIVYSDGHTFNLPCEYLRVHSPSAEVRAHTGEIAKLVTGKQQVNIKKIEPIGQYAVKIYFDDGHNSGLYDWDMLYELGINYEKNWQTYLERCKNSSFKIDNSLSS